MGLLIVPPFGTQECQRDRKSWQPPQDPETMVAKSALPIANWGHKNFAQTVRFAGAFLINSTRHTPRAIESKDVAGRIRITFASQICLLIVAQLPVNLSTISDTFCHCNLECKMKSFTVLRYELSSSNYNSGLWQRLNKLIMTAACDWQTHAQASEKARERGRWEYAREMPMNRLSAVRKCDVCLRKGTTLLASNCAWLCQDILYLRDAFVSAVYFCTLNMGFIVKPLPKVFIKEISIVVVYFICKEYPYLRLVLNL